MQPKSYSYQYQLLGIIGRISIPDFTNFPPKHDELYESTIKNFVSYALYKLAFFFQNGTKDLHNYVKNGQWELEDIKAERHALTYSCCPEPYYDITYTFNLRRQVLYYAMYYIVPCALIALLAATIFVLPQDCSERITVGKFFRWFNALEEI